MQYPVELSARQNESVQCSSIKAFKRISKNYLVSLYNDND